MLKKIYNKCINHTRLKTAKIAQIGPSMRMSNVISSLFILFILLHDYILAAVQPVSSTIRSLCQNDRAFFRAYAVLKLGVG